MKYTDIQYVEYSEAKAQWTIRYKGADCSSNWWEHSAEDTNDRKHFRHDAIAFMKRAIETRPNHWEITDCKGA